MSKSKNYNSIVFLTTLSVYLGLVLVGAPPAVLAQAALTQKIEIKSKAENKDDLDKKPDEKPCSEAELKTSGRDDRFIEQYAALILKLLKTGYVPDKEITAAASGGLDDEFFADLFPTVSKHLTGDFNYSLDSDKFAAHFYFKSEPGNEDVSPVASAINASLRFFLNESQGKPQATILKNTQITFENNQIFIVTRLPRASIDELLAKNAQ